MSKSLSPLGRHPGRSGRRRRVGQYHWCAQRAQRACWPTGGRRAGLHGTARAARAWSGAARASNRHPKRPLAQRHDEQEAGW